MQIAPEDIATVEDIVGHIDACTRTFIPFALQETRQLLESGNHGEAALELFRRSKTSFNEATMAVIITTFLMTIVLNQVGKDAE